MLNIHGKYYKFDIFPQRLSRPLQQTRISPGNSCTHQWLVAEEATSPILSYSYFRTHKIFIQLVLKCYFLLTCKLIHNIR